MISPPVAETSGKDIDAGFTVRPKDTPFNVARDLQKRRYHIPDSIEHYDREASLTKTAQLVLQYAKEQFMTPGLQAGQKINYAQFMDWHTQKLNAESQSIKAIPPSKPDSKRVPHAIAEKAGFYTVKKKDTLFGILHNYRDNNTSGELQRTSVMKHVVTANRLRRRALNLKGDEPLPMLQPGDILNLSKIFSEKELQKTLSTLKAENKGSLKTASKKDYLSSQEVQDLAINTSKRLGQEGIHISPHILYGLAQTESTFNRLAISSANARGLTQLLPGTGKEVWDKQMSSRGQFSEDKLFNAELNMEIGARYLCKLTHRFNGNLQNALAAYNQGPNRWRGKISKSGNNNLGKTNGYAKKVLRYATTAAKKYPHLKYGNTVITKK